MSTLAYAALTRKREEALPDTSTGTQSPGLKTYVDAFAALIPAEVLTAHAAILSVVTVKKDGATTQITDPGTLQFAFVALVAVSVILYVAGRIPDRTSAPRTWETWDWARMWIPALAFVGWTMLQKTTAFDAVAPDLGNGLRFTIPVIGGVLLGVFASRLAYRADQAPPPRPAPSRPQP